MTVGPGPDHSIFDVYIGGTLWQSYDGYASTDGERVIHLPADALLEIRNRADKNLQSTGYVIRFKQLDALEVTYDERTIQYTYDALSRLTEANYNNDAEIFTYGFDLTGNLTNNNGASRTYNAANQMTHDGTNSLTYDDNGNLTNDGVNSYVWDRANRLLSMGGISYVYNGDGNRVQQDALRYILDLQPGLAQVMGDSDGNRFIHAPRGIHAMQNPSGAWSYASQDSLSSVPQEVDAVGRVLASGDYQPFGVLENVQGTFGLPFKFTGEEADFNELVHLRNRYLNPVLGVFPSLDPFEGVINRPMSLNGYMYVEGNTPNATDASGFSPNCCHCDNMPEGRGVRHHDEPFAPGHLRTGASAGGPPLGWRAAQPGSWAAAGAPRPQCAGRYALFAQGAGTGAAASSAGSRSQRARAGTAPARRRS